MITRWEVLPPAPPLGPGVSRSNQWSRETAVGGSQEGSIVANEGPRCTLEVVGSIVEQANQNTIGYGGQAEDP